MAHTRAYTPYAMISAPRGQHPSGTHIVVVNVVVVIELHKIHLTEDDIRGPTLSTERERYTLFRQKERETKADPDRPYQSIAKKTKDC